MNKELDRGAEFMSSRDHIAGKAIAVKGESAEETDFPKSVSGTVQNMYRTVTYVERYQGYGPNDEFTEELCHECALRESVIHGIFYGKENECKRSINECYGESVSV